MKLDLSENDMDGNDIPMEGDYFDVILSKRERDRDYTELRRRIEQKLERRRLQEELGIYNNDWLLDD